MALPVATENVQKSTPPKKNLVEQKKMSEKVRKRSAPAAIIPIKQTNGHEDGKKPKLKRNKSLKTSQEKVQDAITTEGDLTEK